jgi:hypothetical protein
LEAARVAEARVAVVTAAAALVEAATVAEAEAAAVVTAVAVGPSVEE